ncbi:NTP transferase domain-containing protein [Egicoccus sp. AB-alg2]|uniref:nucleotidyltransferase family protein n=1 Tax=Egicoccus sp. AB-alg2 TaxID=3242693 RepID=UPI00359D6220
MTIPAVPTVAVGLVLAAGRASRFGATKQVAEVAGLPMVAHAVATAHAAGLAEVFVVVGHDRAAVTEAARRGGHVVVVHNPEYARGQASSLRCGLEAVAAQTDASVVVVLLADQPGVRPEVVAAVADAAAAAPDGLARARYADVPGHPVGLDRRIWPRLVELEGDAGARQLFDGYDVAVVRVGSGAPPDVDRPADLAGLLAGGGDRVDGADAAGRVEEAPE